MLPLKLGWEVGLCWVEELEEMEAAEEDLAVAVEEAERGGPSDLGLLDDPDPLNCLSR